MADVQKPEKLATVELVGHDSNAFNMIGRCLRAGRRAGYSKEQLAAFQADATSGDYNNVIAACMRWFDVE